MSPAHQPESICILRLSALGDATHVVPVVRSIQANWPGTRITWIIGKLEHRLLHGLDHVEFIEFDKRGGWNAVNELRKKLRDRRFDILLHMQVAARANLLSKLIRAPVRLGWDRARSRDFHHVFVREQVAQIPFQHQVQGFLEFSRALGIKIDEPRWDLPIETDALRWAEEQLGDLQNILLISPCSSHPRRNWPADRFAAVADYASRQLGMSIVLSGGPGTLEIETAAAIERTMQSPCLNLVGKDTLEQSKALLKKGRPGDCTGLRAGTYCLGTGHARHRPLRGYLVQAVRSVQQSRFVCRPVCRCGHEIQKKHTPGPALGNTDRRARCNGSDRNQRRHRKT